MVSLNHLASSLIYTDPLALPACLNIKQSDFCLLGTGNPDFTATEVKQ